MLHHGQAQLHPQTYVYPQAPTQMSQLAMYPRTWGGGGPVTPPQSWALPATKSVCDPADGGSRSSSRSSTDNSSESMSPSCSSSCSSSASSARLTEISGNGSNMGPQLGNAPWNPFCAKGAQPKDRRVQIHYSELPTETPVAPLLFGNPSRSYQKKRRGFLGCDSGAVNPYDVRKRTGGC